MNELRMRYQFNTGHQVNVITVDTEMDDELGMCVFKDGAGITGRESWDIFPKEYVEWLEEQLSDCEAVQEINNLINGRKNKIDPPPDGPIFYDPNK